MKPSDFPGLSEKIADRAAALLRDNPHKLGKEYGINKTGKLPTLYLSQNALYLKEYKSKKKVTYDLSRQPLKYKILKALADKNGKPMSGKALKAAAGSSSVDSIYQAMRELKKKAGFALDLTEDLFVGSPRHGYRPVYRIVPVDNP